MGLIMRLLYTCVENTMFIERYKLTPIPEARRKRKIGHFVTTELGGTVLVQIEQYLLRVSVFHHLALCSENDANEIQ